MPENSTVIANVAPRASGRDARLDFWRGLCLIDMVLVHLIYAEVQLGDFLGTFLTDYTRFAAGGFVFLSGLCMGMIFLPKVIAAGPSPYDARSIYQRIWARSLKLLLVQYASTIALILLNVPEGSRDEMGTPWRFAGDLLRFHKGNDLLLLYVGMLAVTPLLLELMRRRLWPLMIVASAALFAFATHHPWRVSFVPRGEFPVLLWQAVFVSGLLCTGPLRTFDRLTPRLKALILAFVGAAFVVIFQSANASELGIQHPVITLVFAKIPLTFGEYLRYMITTLFVMLVSNAAWRRGGHTRVARFVCLLGRNSLFVYVAHLFVQEAVVALAYRTWEWGRWQILYGVLMIFVLGVMAFWVEQVNAARKAVRKAGAPAVRTKRPVIETETGLPAMS